MFIGLLDVCDTEYVNKAVVVVNFNCCDHGRIKGKMMNKSALLYMLFGISCC
uniref:Uncharacterized protein n=1 Tax=Ciona intestinalis TaxID=7719 RepID=H2XUS7_CIOIN